jgi:hypothetical protein
VIIPTAIGQRFLQPSALDEAEVGQRPVIAEPLLEKEVS